jgi:hypothetical protein
MMDSTLSGTAAWWDFPGASASRWVFSSIHLHFPSNREAIGRVLLFFYPRKHSLPSCGHNFFPLVKGFLAVLCSCTPRPFPCWRSDLGFSSLKLWKVFLELFLLKGTVHCFCSLNLKIGKYLVHMTLSFRDGLYSLGYEILLCVAISHFQLNSSTLSVLARFSCLWVFADKTTRSGLQA